jgi:hypothetical protein
MKRMFKRNSIHVTCEQVVLAPEGFIGEQYASAIKNKKVRIIEIRSLGDGSLFCSLRRNVKNM